MAQYQKKDTRESKGNIERKRKKLNAIKFLKLTTQARRYNIFVSFLEATGNKRDLVNKLKYFIIKLNS